ncbi:MAG: hypothetical protein KKE30_07735 [Gammaproteobacteria bacterium]|nr:hypothetical protein [Gammaproteobacteria bacterium]MBU1553327.1 hypothetical protein [Gammaproteobacteria bacterium]MBU2070771.1 hypothetical protein [Gammaproteobacteria bacterium]MBU2182762.1 hypothetical protein [Gammaproteobacteria bacterium]MBU2205996.1 hypothetical protein [Gammaproteobacteria bacterium]
MLKKYLQTQQDNFDLMRSRFSQLQQLAEQEQQRSSLLSQHINGMESSEQMACSLSLQNLSGLKGLMHDMAAQQQLRSEAAVQEANRQQQACNKQAAYNLAIAQLLEQRQQRQLLKQQRQEQKLQDEIAMQMLQRLPL